MIKNLLVICAFIALSVATEDIFFSEKYVPKPAHVPAAYLHNGSYSPKLDHFRPQDPRTVTFHYRLNIDNYREGGPLFFYINDLGEFTTEWIEEGLVVDVARQAQGALIAADHRYFGLNIPTETAEFDDLEFLTIDNAVADIAFLVSTVQEHLASPNPRVIVWGTGYGATLATFARKKYPHLIDAAFASSGKFRAEVFDTSYHDNLSANLRQHGSQECFARVQTAFNVLEYLIENAESDYLQERFRLCTALDSTNSQEVGLLVEKFIDLISNYIRRNSLFGLQNFCRDMAYYNEDPLNSLVRWGLYVYGTDDCFNTNYNDYIDQLRETEWEASPYTTVRAMSYFRCTQFGAFRIGTDYEMSAFPELLDGEYHYRFCEDILGEQYNREALIPAVNCFNARFGGQDQIVPNVIFTNAGLDPWIGHGVSDFDIENSEVIFLYYSPSGADLTSISLDEPIELTHAKERIFERLVEWALLE